MSDNRKEIESIQEQLAGLNEGIEQNEQAAIASMRELLERRKALDEQKRNISTYFGATILP
ncbi:MAG: hypothetical protein ACPG08_00280 [Flavobacteriales bacterium]